MVIFDRDDDASHLNKLDGVVEVEVQGVAGGGLVLIVSRTSGEVVVDVVAGELDPDEVGG